MLKHRWTDRVCCIVLALTLLLTGALMGAQSAGMISAKAELGYESRLFDQSRVHAIEIVMDDWEGFLETCTDEQYAPCTVIIDGEKYANVGIRAKGNTSLSSVRAYGNNRYSFKIEFDQYSPGGSYHGLDKLSLNNLIQDNTLMKDYMAYTMMNKMGAAAPLCSYVNISVNGEVWGLYLAVEAVEDSFLRRNYGADYGELYKPDSLSFGGGRGNGMDFNMDDFAAQFSGESEDSGESRTGGFSFPQMGGFDPSQMGDFDPSQMGGFDPSQMGGFDFSRMGGMTPPAGEPEASGEENSGEENSGEENSGEENSGGKRESSRMSMHGGFGGFGGMGSNDVKLVYTDDDPDSYPNIFNSAKTEITGNDKTRLIAALKAMNEGDTSAVDTDAVIRYLAVHSFLCNDDSYTGMMVHNYYLYEEDGVLSLIPWDYNLAMGGFGGFGGFGGSGATSTVNSPIDTPVSDGDASSRPMVAWIFDSEETLAQYHEVYDEFISTLFESGWYEETVTAVAEMIAPYVEADPTKFCTSEEFETGVEALKEFGALRARSVRGQLDGTIPSTTAAQRQDSSALVDAAHLDLSVMGSMGNMGGGFGGDRGGFSRGERQGAPGADAMSGATPEAEATAQPETTAAPEATAAPETTAAPEATAAPEMGSMPDMGQMPGGMTPPDMGQFPGGMTPPDMGSMPDMGQMPEGMVFPNMGGMPG